MRSVKKKKKIDKGMTTVIEVPRGGSNTEHIIHDYNKSALKGV